MRRLPAIIVIDGLLVAGVVVDRNRRDHGDSGATTAPSAAERAAELLPVAAPAGALASTWYCAAGTATKDGIADHVVVVANPTDHAVHGTITVYAGAALGQEALATPKTVQAPVDVGPQTRHSIRLREIGVDAPFAAALVEVEGGDVAVEHLLEGPRGRTVAPCASSASPTWYFAAGATTKDAKEILALFNPFPDDAIVDLSFATEEGFRTPVRYTGLVVPGGTVVNIDVGTEVTRRTRVSTSVRARNGRLVVDRLQVYDNTAGAQGMTVSLGAPRTAQMWLFPDGFSSPKLLERYVIYNPGRDEAQVDLEITPRDPDQNGSPEPFELTIAPRDSVTVVTNEQRRVPAGVAHTATVRSVNGVGVVAERFTYAIDAARDGRRGVSATLGSPAVAPRWLLGAGGATAELDEWIVVRNADDRRPVTVDVTALAKGQSLAVEDLQGLRIAPGASASFRLGDHIRRNDLPLLVEGSGPIVVERGLYWVGSVGVANTVGIPLPAGIAIPNPSD
jgi:hypothetical protein